MLLVIHFLHPAFLWGLFALAVPVILHLFSFKRYKKVYFSNFNFLAALQQQKKNSSRLRNLLLLLLRLTVIAAVVVAFATPYAPPGAAATSASGPKAQIILYADNSFSMSNTGSKGSLLEEAKKHLFDIVSSYPAGTHFTLITNDPSPATSLTREQAITALSALRTSAAPKKLSAVLSEARETAGTQAATLFLVSDFQQNNCDLAALSPDSLPETVFLVMNPENRNNLYIKDIRFAQAFHKKDQTDKIIITTANASGKEYNNVAVTLTINGKKKSISKINIPADGETETEISYMNTEGGFCRGMAEIADLPVLFDNRYFFSYAVGGNTNILCLEQDYHTPHFGKLFSDSTAFSMAYHNINQAANTNFSACGLVILDGCVPGSTGMESALENYVANGGNLLVLPHRDSRTFAGPANRMLQKMRVPLFGMPDTAAIISGIETQSALFREAFREDGKTPVLPYIRRFLRLEETGGAEQLLTDKKGNTLLAARSFGKGNIYVSAFSFDPDNSNMVYHPLFVPLMVNMACNVSSALSPSFFLHSGKPVTVDSRTDTENGHLRMVSDDGTLEFIPEIRKDFSGSLVLANNGNIRSAGLYELTQDGNTADILAFNYDRNESQMRFCTAEELSAHFPEARVESIHTTQLTRNSELVRQIVLEDNNRYFSVWLFLLAVIALIAEQWMWKRKLM